MIRFESKEKLNDFVRQNIIGTSEASEIYGCSRQYIQKLVQQGKLHSVAETLRERLFWREDVEQLNKYKPNGI